MGGGMSFETEQIVIVEHKLQCCLLNIIKEIVVIMMINKCKLVRETCSWVYNQCSNVRIDREKIQILANKFSYTPFNLFEHHVLTESKENEQNILLYLFTLDSLNFCFWPLEGFEYEHLAGSVKAYIEKGGAIDKLSRITQEELKFEIFSGINVPLADERARILRQMAGVIIEKFDSSIVSLVSKSNNSAVSLLNILTENFPNFQDHTIYKGHQIHFYKRSQILIGDIYAKFQGKGLGRFFDISELTMFPDYRVPQILNEYGVLVYSQSLAEKIENKVQIPSGSEEEIQIRAASVKAVEEIKHFIKMKGRDVTSIEVDWFLWEEGEKSLDNIINHHRTLTIYY